MKKIFYILLLVLGFSCNSEQANDCLQTSGALVYKHLEVAAFESVLVNRNIQLTIRQGEQTKVEIEAGENIIEDVSVEVVMGELQLTDNNTCNLFRNYDPVKITLTTPNVKLIRSSTQFEIKTDGKLTVESLQLISEDYNLEESFNVGDFNMELDVNTLNVVSNNISIFYIYGRAQKVNVGFYAGAGRFEGGNLIADQVYVTHKGSNDMVVYPKTSLKGELRGTGNLLSRYQPEIVEVKTLYKGELIFID